MTFVHYNGGIAAIAGATRFYLAPHLEGRPPGDPECCMVAFMAQHALDVRSGAVSGPYSDERAERLRGATALPPGRGIWRRGDGELIVEDTAVVFCVADPNVVTPESMRSLGNFARVMGKETNQGEVGIIVGGRYNPITDF